MTGDDSTPKRSIITAVTTVVKRITKKDARDRMRLKLVFGSGCYVRIAKTPKYP
uniref:Uncharacterized protein n=1 Tax=Arundo donax TaxID=35708 RepID=A0A0A9BG91_ARUDO